MPNCASGWPVGAIAQASEFSWEATAQRTLDVYRRARHFMREAG